MLGKSCVGFQVGTPADSKCGGSSELRQGQDSFQAYWGSRALSDLEQAKDHFGQAERSDPDFALTTFYVAIADNELRQHDSAIARLNALAERGVEFLPR